MRKTKIVCTIGPASWSEETLKQLILAGMDVARLNMSHGDQTRHAETAATIRKLAEKQNRPIALLFDLAGPKVRTGKIPDGPVTLTKGQTYVLTARDVPGNTEEVSLTYKGLPGDVTAGDTLLLADAAIELAVKSVEGDDISCEVVVGGELSSSKGINLPSKSLNVPFLSDKDRSDIAFAVAQDADYVACSFVRSVADVQQVLDEMDKAGGRVPTIAKIEKHEALEVIDDILDLVDGVMVARGDLGVEIPIERLPAIQKMLIEKTDRRGKPVITATQMLKSMVSNPRPSRAEVADVANAVLDGTDGVMLSEETAMGQYPVKAVEMMAKVAVEAEKSFAYASWIENFEGAEDLTPGEAVALSACRLAGRAGAAAIVVPTQSGSTARSLAKYRTPVPILALTPVAETYRRLALVWGAVPMMMDSLESSEDIEKASLQCAIKSGLVNSGETVVITAGFPLHVPGTTNTIKVLTA